MSHSFGIRAPPSSPPAARPLVRPILFLYLKAGIFSFETRAAREVLSPGRVTLPFSDAECFCQSGFMAFIFRVTAAPILLFILKQLLISLSSLDCKLIKLVQRKALVQADFCNFVVHQSYRS